MTETPDQSSSATEASATLDPPGSIVVVGAGPLGIEAALYGRYLGYQVTLLEAAQPVGWMETSSDQPVPMLPGRSVSPLALSALAAQQAAGAGIGKVWDEPTSMPLTIGQWRDQIWSPLLETDLLRGRLTSETALTGVQWAPAEEDAAEDTEEELEEGDIPPDFRLNLSVGDPLDAEALILAIGADESTMRQIEFQVPVDAEYLFRIGEQPTGQPEADFWNGLRQVVALYASLAGRADLDLYLPPAP